MTYRYSLDTTAKKVLCNGCKQKTAKRYIDLKTNQYLPMYVQRCDRQNNCGHCYSPKDYFRDHPDKQPEAMEVELPKPAAVKYETIPSTLVRKSMQGFMESNLARYIYSKYPDQAREVLELYQVGRSAEDGGRATVFWQIDDMNRIRYGKIMHYDPITGKRRKDTQIHSIPKPYKPENFLQTFFGTHLLTKYPHKPVAIVESEKTALLYACIIKEYNWLATGGSSGCKWREQEVFKVLSGRTVIFFPDFGYYSRNDKYPRNAWKTCYQEWYRRVNYFFPPMQGNFSVSRILEDNLKDEMRDTGPDIADFIHRLKFINLLLAQLTTQPLSI